MPSVRPAPLGRVAGPPRLLRRSEALHRRLGQARKQRRPGSHLRRTATYQSPNGRFRALLPGDPSVGDRPADSKAGTAGTETYCVIRLPPSYMIECSHLAEPHNPEGRSRGSSPTARAPAMT